MPVSSRTSCASAGRSATAATIDFCAATSARAGKISRRSTSRRTDWRNFSGAARSGWRGCAISDSRWSTRSRSSRTCWCDTRRPDTIGTAMMIHRKIVVLTLLLASFAAGAAEAEEAGVRKEFQAKFPRMTIDSVGRTPFAGVYEVVVDGQVFYTDAKVSYLFSGNLLDVR